MTDDDYPEPREVGAPYLDQLPAGWAVYIGHEYPGEPVVPHLVGCGDTPLEAWAEAESAGYPRPGSLLFGGAS